MKIIDGTGLVLGRLASKVAKEALKGEEISIVNSEKALIKGHKADILLQYNEIRTVGSKYNGPFFPRQPNLIVRRTIRGMLPYKKENGRNAYGRIKVYIGVPKTFEGKPTSSYDDAKAGLTAPKHLMTVEQLSRHLGWHN